MLDVLGHDALASDLASFLGNPKKHSLGYLTWENVEFRTDNYGWCRPDVYAIQATLSQKKWSPITFEVKVSRADLLADLRTEKWKRYLPFSARVAIAAPFGIVKPVDLPANLGLIQKEKNGWVWVKRGQKNNDWELDSRAWMNLCLKTRNPSPYERAKGDLVFLKTYNP